MDVTKAVKDIKGGKIEFRVDKNGNLSFLIGKLSFTEQALDENFKAVADEIKRLKPSTGEGPLPDQGNHHLHDEPRRPGRSGGSRLINANRLNLHRGLPARAGPPMSYFDSLLDSPVSLRLDSQAGQSKPPAAGGGCQSLTDWGWFLPPHIQKPPGTHMRRAAFSYCRGRLSVGGQNIDYEISVEFAGDGALGGVAVTQVRRNHH